MSAKVYIVTTKLLSSLGVKLINFSTVVDELAREKEVASKAHWTDGASGMMGERSGVTHERRNATLPPTA